MGWNLAALVQKAIAQQAATIGQPPAPSQPAPTGTEPVKDIVPVIGPNNVLYALNPATGQYERFYRYDVAGGGAEGGVPDPESYHYYFESDLQRPALALLATYQREANDLLEPVVVGGLLAITGVGIGAAFAGAGAAAEAAGGVVSETVAVAPAAEAVAATSIAEAAPALG